MAISINNSYQNNMQDFYLQNAEYNASKTLKNISANRAIDSSNPANMVVADFLKSDMNAMKQGVENANNAFGMLQIADSTLSNLTKNTDRLNELSVKSNNAIMGSNEQKALLNETKDLLNSMQISIDNATFNGKNVFGGISMFQTGNGEFSVNLSAPNLSSIDITDQNSISNFMNSVNTLRSDIGYAQKGLISSINVTLGNINSATSSESQLQDNDIVKNIQELTKANDNITTSTFTLTHNSQILQNKIASLLS